VIRPGGRGREWGALAALVLVSTALRAWAAVAVPVPWIAPDELVYGMLGRGLYLHGSLDILGGPTPFYSLLTPALIGFPLSAFGLDTGHDVLQGLQAFVMSLAAVPVYLWSRTLVSRRAAFVAAALTLAAPGLVYSGLMMTEVLFYPLLVLAAWAGAEAITRPTRLNQGLLVLAVLAASATRIQAIVLLPVLATAVVVDAAIGRSWANLRRLLPAAAGLGVLVLAWVGWRLGSGSGTLGGYEVVASAPYSVDDAARFVLYHAASLLIICGLFPAAALALMVIRAARVGEPDPRVRAYLAIAVSLAVWLVVEVGVFASRYSDRIVERNLIALAPVLFVGLMVWLERGPAGHYVERAAVALAAAGVLLALPIKRYVNLFGTHDAMTLIPFYKLEQATSPGTLAAVYSVVAALAAVCFALLPRPALRAVPVVLLVAFVAASVVSSRFVVRQTRAQQTAFLGSDPRWVDEAVQGSTAYVYDGEPSWPGVWETVFWNPRIDRVYDLPDAEVPGPLPQRKVFVTRQGEMLMDGAPSRVRHAVISSWFTLVGEPVAQVTQFGLSQTGLRVWNVQPPLRLSTRITSVQPNGDVYAGERAQIAVYGCTRGTFRLTLLIKEAETVDLVLNGNRVRHLTFPSPSAQPVWRGTIPVSVHRPTTCFLQIRPSGLLGSTVLAFDRS
jgi:hypothetical protein